MGWEDIMSQVVSIIVFLVFAIIITKSVVDIMKKTYEIKLTREVIYVILCSVVILCYFYYFYLCAILDYDIGFTLRLISEVNVVFFVLGLAVGTLLYVIYRIIRNIKKISKHVFVNVLIKVILIVNIVFMIIMDYFAFFSSDMGKLRFYGSEDIFLKLPVYIQYIVNDMNLEESVVIKHENRKIIIANDRREVVFRDDEMENTLKYLFTKCYVNELIINKENEIILRLNKIKFHDYDYSFSQVKSTKDFESYPFVRDLGNGWFLESIPGYRG